MAYNHFDYVPSTIDRRRSVFKYDKAVASCAYIGYLYPVCKPERMQPGSSISLNLAAEFRSGALVSPLMDELYVDFFSFFVPNRIVWEHWKQFLGAIDEVLFNSLTSYSIPSFKFGFSTAPISGQETFEWNQTIACHFGLPYPGTSGSTLSHCPPINALPFRGYTFIWNEYFRPEQIVSPQNFGKADSGWNGMNMDYSHNNVYTLGGVSVFIPEPKNNSSSSQNVPLSGGAILPVYRAHRNLWTSCLPAPSLQTMNLLATVSPAPVGFIADDTGTTSSAVSVQLPSGTAVVDRTLAQLRSNGGGGVGLANADIIADIKQSILTVNNYRETIMLQNYYDVLNRAGSRYDEILYNIFGARSSAAVTDIPELITHKRFTIYRKEVVAMANSTDANSNVEPIGSQSAYIDTVIHDNFFTRSTTEHGYIHMMYAIRPARIRTAQGIEAEWSELNKMDLYYPQFDGMGDVGRLSQELYYDFSLTADQNKSILFGYQEYGATWKYQRNEATGFLDRLATTKVPGFTLQEALSSAPALNSQYLSCWLECQAFADCLALPNPRLAPQFIVDIRLTGTITHPMPTYNIPGNGALL